ncbi:MAG: hypothetical protein AAGC60_16815 [Acidobacteriota bacterium]
MSASGALRRRTEGGWALVAVLVVLLILSLAASLVASHLWTRQQAVRRQVIDVHLQALADSGLSLAMAQITAARYSGAEDEAEIGDGQVRYRVVVAGSGVREVEIEAAFVGWRRAGTARVLVPNAVDPVELLLWQVGGSRPDDGAVLSPPIILPPPPPVD